MPSPLTKLVGAANFSRSRVEHDGSVGMLVPKLLTRSVYEVDKMSRGGLPFRLSDLVGVPAPTQYAQAPDPKPPSPHTSMQ